MRKFIPSDPRIAQYEPLVKSRARRFWRGWTRKLWDLEDLEAMARASILEAIARWDPARGASFGTYVTRIITTAMMNAAHFANEKKRQGVAQSITSVDGYQLDLPARELAPAERLDAMQVRQSVRDAVDALSTPRLKDIIERRFWRDQTLTEIGESYGITRERIRQLEAKAFAELRPQLQDLWVGAPIGDAA